GPWRPERAAPEGPGTTPGPADEPGPERHPSLPCALGLRDQLDLLPDRAGAAHVELGLLDLRARAERGGAAAAFAHLTVLVVVMEEAGVIIPLVVAVVVVEARRAALEVVAVAAAADLGVFGHFARHRRAVGERELQYAAFEGGDRRGFFGRRCGGLRAAR